jgi:hypothetical protein
MLIENTSDLIQSVQVSRLASGKRVDLAQLINGQVLAISDDSMALYRRFEDIHDELGNGLCRSVAIPAEFHLSLQGDVYLQEHKAGYVGLSDGRVLLITLNDVQMFPSKQDALRNQNEIVRLALG